MNNRPGFEALPASLEDLLEQWPGKLREILTESRSPANPEEVIASLEADADFMALIDGWNRMPSAAQANAWQMIEERLWEAARRTREFCLRCGECCRKGSPVLYDQDRPALAAGAIRRSDLVTMRVGEIAWSNREQKMVIVTREQVKIKTIPDARTCVFLGAFGDACMVYEHRPHQCRIMECWDPSRFKTLLSLPPVSRLGLLGTDNPLGQLIRKHEEAAGVPLLAKSLSAGQDSDPGSLEPALEIILFDLHVRQFAMEKLGLAEDELGFFFGTPLTEVCQSFGYVFSVDDAGIPKLTRTEPAGTSGQG